jgi:hypothetical protein
MRKLSKWATGNLTADFADCADGKARPRTVTRGYGGSEFRRAERHRFDCVACTQFVRFTFSAGRSVLVMRTDPGAV